MKYRIAPGSALDQALNVLVADQLGETPPYTEMSVSEAIATIEPIHEEYWVMLALGTRAWFGASVSYKSSPSQIRDLVEKSPSPKARQMTVDQLEACWFGGYA